MFGVSLSIRKEDFQGLVENPKPALAGILAQFLVLPALTFLLIVAIRPQPSIALGVILVAACPGGNISNFITHLSKGNTALSLSLTSFSSVAAVILTPLNFKLWASFYGPTAAILNVINIDIMEIFSTVVLIIGIPLLCGMYLNSWRPKIAEWLSKAVKPLSIIIFIGFIVIAFSNNATIFFEKIHLVIFLVFIHNGLALSIGYLTGTIFKLPLVEKRTLAIETGIQNSGLGLLLIFTFFDGLGGMALVAAWWGIWHIITGLALALIWGRNKNYPALHL